MAAGLHRVAKAAGIGKITPQVFDRLLARLDVEPRPAEHEAS
jgi:hypothetical protein